jgi:hypothetical protein
MSVSRSNSRKTAAMARDSATIWRAVADDNRRRSPLRRATTSRHTTNPQYLMLNLARPSQQCFHLRQDIQHMDVEDAGLLVQFEMLLDSYRPN